MNAKYQLQLSGKVIEVVKPDEKCFVRVQIDPFLIEIPCLEMNDFRLEDEFFIQAEISFSRIIKKDEFINQATQNLEVSNER